MKSSIGRISEHLLRELKDTPHGLTWQNFWTTSVSAIFLLAVLIQVASAQQARTSKVTVENASDYAAEIQMKDSNPGQYQTVGQIFPGQKGTFSINVGSEWRYIFETPDGRVNEDYVVKNQPFQTWTLTAKTNTRPTPPGPIGGKKDSSQTTAINGHNLTSVDVYFGATKTGVIRQKSPGQWEWVEGEQNHPWREVRRTDTSVFLTDQESYIELNILRGGIFGSDNRFQTGDRYYLLKNPVAGNTAPPLPSSNVTGRNVTFVEKYTADTLAGRFRQLDGNSWREESALNSDTRDWTEVRRDENSVYLSSGGQIVQIDVKTPGIFVSQDNFQSRFQIYDVRNAKADAQSHPIDRSAQVILNNVGNQPLTIVEQNGKALKNFGDLAAGSRKTFDTIMGRILVVKGPDGSELTRIDVDSPLQARSLAMSSPPMPTDRTSTTPNLAKWYQIKHVQTGAVLDVPASSEENGVQIGVYANFDTPNQQFRFQQASNGHYFLVNRNSGKGVAAENISAQAGAKVVQYENGPGENDQFRIQSASGQNVYLIFKHSNKPLAIVDNTAIQGATLDRSAEFQLIAVADFKVGPNPPHDGGGDKMPPHSEDQGAGFTVNYFELWEQGSELYLTFRETNQTKWQSETTFGGKSSKWSVAKKEQDSIWLKHDVYNDSFEVNFLTGEVNLHADGVLVVKSRNLRLKNDKHRESTPGDDSIASFDPEWYDTPDQRKFRGLFANKRPGADSWGNAPRQVPNMQTNYSTTFYLPEMHPYRFGMEHCGCDEPLPPFAEISFDSQDFVSEIGGYSYPKTFFFTSEGTRGGKLERVGQIFFSETERQEAFAASASVEASGWGVSVGLSGDYGQGKSTTDSTENASVVITSHAGRYWLVLNKKEATLNDRFKEKVLQSRNPQEFFRKHGSHYPLAVLYGFRAFYDEKIDTSSFSKSSSSNWGVGASAGGGAFGVDVAVSASYNQEYSAGSANSKTKETVQLETVGGEVIEESAGTTDESSAPIKVVLRPIYELIRPDKFPGVDPSVVLAKRERFKQAYERMMVENAFSPAKISSYEMANGVTQPTRHSDVISQGNRKYSKIKGQEIGTPVLFTFVATNFTPINGTNTIRVTDNQNRTIVVKPDPDIKNSWVCYMTVVPQIRNGQYDYQEYAYVTVQGGNATQSFRLESIGLGKDPYRGRNLRNMRTPKFASTAFLNGDNPAATYIVGYAERAFESTVSDQNALGLPLAPWE